MTRKMTDLTHPLYHGLEGYPGNARVEVEALHRVEVTGYNVSKVSFDSHLGTHLDVPGHINPGGAGVDRIDLRKLIGPAHLFDVTPKPPGSEIGLADLGKSADRVGEGSRVVFRTGWERLFGTPAFFQNFPGIAPELAEWLRDRGVILVGIEQPSVHPTLHLEIHHALIDAGVVVVEALANLGEIRGPDFELLCLPLRIKDCDGSPCRAVAIEEIP